MADTKPLASLSSGLLARKGTAKPAMRRQGLSAFAPSETDMSSFHDDLGWNDMGYDVDPQHEKNAKAVDAETLKNANPLMNAVPEVVRQRDDLAERLKASDSAVTASNEAPSGRDDAPEGEGAGIDGAGTDSAHRDDEAEALAPDQETAFTGAPIEMANSPLAVKNSPLAFKKSAIRVTMDETDVDTDVPEEPSASKDAERAPAEAVPVRAAATMALPKKPVRIPEPLTETAAKGKRAAFTLRVDPERHLKLRLACAIQNVSAQQFVTQALDAMLASVPELNDLASKVPANRSQ